MSGAYPSDPPLDELEIELVPSSRNFNRGCDSLEKGLFLGRLKVALTGPSHDGITKKEYLRVSSLFPTLRPLNTRHVTLAEILAGTQRLETFETPKHFAFHRRS